MFRLCVRKKRVVILSVAVGLFLLATAHHVCASENPQARDLETLSQNAIEPTRASAEKLLREFAPNAALLEQARELILQLGNQKFSVRESAMEELIKLPVVPLALLHEAATSADSETAYRAQAILDDARTKEKLRGLRKKKEIAAAMLRVIRYQPISETTALIIETVPFLEAWDLELAAADAIAVVAESKDIPLLQKSISSDNRAVKSVAIRGLGHAGGRSVNSELRKFCADSDSAMVLAAAHALAEQSDAAALPPLIQLLTDEKQEIRIRSTQILRSLTQQNFGFNPYAHVADQLKAIAKWQAWLEAQQGDPVLHLPIEILPLNEDLSAGLIVHYHFDGDVDADIHDVSGNAKDGQAANAFAFKPRGAGKAIELTGAGHHGDTGGHATLPFVDFSTLQEFTLAIWVKETAMTHEEGEAYVTYGTDTGVGFRGALGISHYNFDLLFRVGGGEVRVPYDILDRDQWTHYAMTWQDGLLRGYKNGQLIAETEADVAVQTERAALGRHWWGDGAGTSARFQGELDDLRIYNRSLTKEQILTLFENTQ
jgi:HEAT repeat protein